MYIFPILVIRILHSFEQTRLQEAPSRRRMTVLRSVGFSIRLHYKISIHAIARQSGGLYPHYGRNLLKFLLCLFTLEVLGDFLMAEIIAYPTQLRRNAESREVLLICNMEERHPKLPSRFDEYGGDLSSSSLEILFEETHNPSEKNSQPESRSCIQSGERAGPWQSPGPSISGPSSTGRAAYFNSSTSPHTSLPSTKSQDGIKESISGQHGSVSVPHNLPALLSITQPSVSDYLPNVVPPQQFIPWPTSSFQFSNWIP